MPRVARLAGCLKPVLLLQWPCVFDGVLWRARLLSLVLCSTAAKAVTAPLLLQFKSHALATHIRSWCTLLQVASGRARLYVLLLDLPRLTVHKAVEG